MDIFIMIYGYFGFLLIIGMFLYFKKVDKKHNNVNKGIIKPLYLYEDLGFTGIVFFPYTIVAMFLCNGICADTLVFNCILFILFILSVFCFVYAKVYRIEYSKDSFVIKKYKTSVKFYYNEINVVIKPTLFRIYKNGKKICTISHRFQKNSYDFLKKIYK